MPKFEEFPSRCCWDMRVDNQTTRCLRPRLSPARKDKKLSPHLYLCSLITWVNPRYVFRCVWRSRTGLLSASPPRSSSHIRQQSHAPQKHTSGIAERTTARRFHQKASSYGVITDCVKYVCVPHNPRPSAGGWVSSPLCNEWSFRPKWSELRSRWADARWTETSRSAGGRKEKAEIGRRQKTKQSFI